VETPRLVPSTNSWIRPHRLNWRHSNKSSRGGGVPPRFLKARTSTGCCSVDLIADMLVDGDHCLPKPTTVAIVQAVTEPGVLLYPQCTRVMRCGGCCGHDALECVPTRAQRVNVKVGTVSFKNAEYNNCS